MIKTARHNAGKKHKEPISLRLIYLMVGLTGTIMVALILFGYYNGERLHDINSPLLAACQEIRLEAATARHGIGDILGGEVVHSPSYVWAYLDQSIWYLQNLLESNARPYNKWIDSTDSDIGHRIADLKIALEALKAYSSLNTGKIISQGQIDETLLRYDRYFKDFLRQLEQVEAGISGLITKERFLYRFSHVGLMAFCIFMLGFVVLAFQRYERYRKDIYDDLNNANVQLKHQIEERERVEKALKESENLFRTVFDTSPDSVILSRLLDNTIVAVNNGFIELTGFSKEEVLGKTAMDLSLWEDIEKRERFLSILESSRYVRNFESRFRMKNGHLQTALLSVNIVDIGDVPHFITVARNISDLKKVENALRESEEKFRGLFEHAVDFIHLLDLEGRILLSNPAAIRGLGYALSQLQNRPLADFVDPAAKPCFVEMMPQLAEKGHFRKECNLTTGDGRVITVDCSAAPVRNFEGDIDFIVVFQEDISERKTAERKLLAAYEFLQMANRHDDLKSLLMEFIDTTRLMTGCSAATLRILDENGVMPCKETDGFSAELCRIEDLLTAEKDQALCAQVLKNKTANGLPNFTPNGSFFTNQASPIALGLCARNKCKLAEYRSLALIPIRLGPQNLGLFCIADKRADMLSAEAVDILETATVQLGTAIQRLRAEEGLQTAYQVLEDRVMERTLELSQVNAKLEAQIEERRRAEDNLRENRNMMQTIIDGITDALILVDRDMRIRMVNRKAVELYNIETSEKAIGQTCFSANGQIGPCDGCKIPQAVARGDSITFERGALKDNDRLEEISIYPVKKGVNDEGGAIVRIADITEEKRLERQLIQSEKMASLGILVSSIAHEINNPNNFVTFNIPILRDYLEELVEIADRHAENHFDFELFHMSYPEFRKDVFKLVDNIEHGARRISSFVANLREFSQGNGNQKKAMLDLPVVVEKVLSICRSQIKKRVKNFEMDLLANLPPVYADEYSLEQVLLNLIVNAVQAADKKDSLVKLSAWTGRHWRDHTIIEISDNGCGIDKKMIDRIFNPFFTTKSAEEGTGLGLYVCHNLIQSLGGTIEVKSQPGEGSTFTVSLPDKDRRKEPRTANATVKEVPILAGSGPE